MTPAAPLTVEQRMRAAEMIAAGHSNDLVIAHFAGCTPEQVADLRRQGLTKPPSRKKPR